jgi:PAS domain S-box-containing protein
MTKVSQASDNDFPLVDRRARSGTLLRILLLALVLVAAAVAFVYFKDSLENEVVLGILGVLAMLGIFFLVSSAIGFIEVMPQSQSDGMARQFLSSHPDGTLITDPKGRLVYANATYCQMTGATKATEIQSLEALLSRDRESTEALYRLINALREGKDGYEEFRLLKPLSETTSHSGPHWYRLKARLLKDASGNDLHVFQIAGAVLDADENAGEIIAQAGDNIMRNGNAGYLRNVVENDLQAVILHTFDHLGIGAVNTLCAHALVVERRQQNDGGHTGLDRMAGQFDGVGNGCLGRAGQELLRGNAACNCFFQNVHALFQAEGIGLAGGAEKRHAITAFLDQRLAMGGEQAEIRRAICGNGGGCGGVDATDFKGFSHCSSSFLQSACGHRQWPHSC